MKHPDPDRLLLTADKLEAFIKTRPRNKRKVNMKQGYIDSDCDTPGCVAGWISLAFGYRHVAGQLFGEASTKWSNWVGRKNGFEFDDWGDANPNLWGNPFGSGIWSHAIAWGAEDEEKMTASQITRRLRTVAKRIQKHQAQESVK